MDPPVVCQVKLFQDSTRTTMRTSVWACEMEDSSPPDGGEWTIKQLVSQFQKPLEVMPSVLTAIKHALTFGASIARQIHSER